MKPIRQIIGTIKEFITTKSNAVGQRVRITTQRFASTWRREPINDWSRPDYDFWRRAYRAHARGLEVSGLLIKPLVNKIAGWVMSQPPTWKLDSADSAAALSEWWSGNHSDILKSYRDSVKLGDSFLVVNGDMTLSVIPPQFVEAIISDDDYSQQLGWRITQTYIHPDQTTSNTQTIIDEYTEESRVRSLAVNGVVTETITYPNIIGLVPVIHIGNNIEPGETFGRPEAEGLVNVLQRYGVVMEAAIEGNEMQGRPTPVLSFDSVADMNAFWGLYGENETVNHSDGTTEQITTLAVDLKQILTVSGASFDYKSPGAFVAEAQKLLELMFYLILEHTELPEFVFGNAVASSQASVNTQLPVFAKFIEMKRGEAEKWMRELADVVLAYLSLITPGVVAETPSLQWDDLTNEDGTLTLTAVQWAFAEGLIDRRTALQLMPVDVEDIEAVLLAAEEETESLFPENAEPTEAQNDNMLEDEINKLELEDGTNGR